jgi:hypothetical protein
LSIPREGTSERLLALLNPGRLLTGIYVGRLVAASANFVVATALTAVWYRRSEPLGIDPSTWHRKRARSGVEA